MTVQHSALPTTCVVLLADDDPDILSLCAELLTWSGHTVETATNGPMALAALRTGRFEAAVLDIGMSGKSGIDVAREVRAGNATKRCVIILHTSLAKCDVDARFDDYDAYVAKPCFGNELATTLSSSVAAGRLTWMPNQHTPVEDGQVLGREVVRERLLAVCAMEHIAARRSRGVKDEEYAETIRRARAKTLTWPRE